MKDGRSNYNFRWIFFLHSDTLLLVFHVVNCLSQPVCPDLIFICSKAWLEVMCCWNVYAYSEGVSVSHTGTLYAEITALVLFYIVLFVVVVMTVSCLLLIKWTLDTYSCADGRGSSLNPAKPLQLVECQCAKFSSFNKAFFINNHDCWHHFYSWVLIAAPIKAVASNAS